MSGAAGIVSSSGISLDSDSWKKLEAFCLAFGTIVIGLMMILD